MKFRKHSSSITVDELDLVCMSDTFSKFCVDSKGRFCPFYSTPSDFRRFSCHNLKKHRATNLVLEYDSNHGEIVPTKNA